MSGSDGFLISSKLQWKWLLLLDRAQQALVFDLFLTMVFVVEEVIFSPWLVSAESPMDGSSGLYDFLFRRLIVFYVVLLLSRLLIFALSEIGERNERDGGKIDYNRMIRR